MILQFFPKIQIHAYLAKFKLVSLKEKLNPCNVVSRSWFRHLDFVN